MSQKRKVKWTPPLPTNQFSVKVVIPFPKSPEINPVIQWFNIQNCGRPSIPLTEKVSPEHKERAYTLHRCREFTFVFEINAEGEWTFVGRKA